MPQDELTDALKDVYAQATDDTPTVTEILDKEENNKSTPNKDNN